MADDGSCRDVGLSSEQAARRLVDDGPNELPAAKRRTFVQLAWSVVREPMLLLLVGAGTLNFLLSEPLDGVIMLSFVVVVITISIVQEHKTETALVALRDLSSPRALVMRDGRQIRVAGRDVVRGDLVLLAEGDRVPADAVIVECANLAVDESTMTGESVPVTKTAVAASDPAAGMGRPGGDGTAWVFSGTLVVRGHGAGVVVETGRATELGRIGTALRTIEADRTPLQLEVRRMVRAMAVVSVAAATVVVVVLGLTRSRWLEAFLAGIGTAMSMLPEEFPVVLTVFLAMGAWRMSQHHVLTRRSAAIETLGSATVVCVDKTGTLTMNQMTVRELIVDGEQHRLDVGPLPETFHVLAEFAVLAAPLDPFDPMDRAFRELARSQLAGTEHVHANWELVREYPLSEALLALSHVWRSPDLAEYVVAAKGAPEAILDLCHLDAGSRERVMQQVAAATANGRRVLAVAKARFGHSHALPSEQHDFTFELLGLVSLHDPVRAGAADAVAECRRAGVRVLMITGDHPGTAVAIAREVGLDGADRCITGAEMDAMSVDELAAQIATVGVFARMVPEQKLHLIRALTANGEIVVMTGDGVNDAPALRAADVGIAMGQRGTDVARESAALVLTDDDFASIVSGIRQGRGIFDNLRKAMSYVIAVHVPIFAMSLIPVFSRSWPLVLLPLQIAFLQLIIDPACSIVFEADEVDPDIMNRPPRSPGAPMFGRHVLTIVFCQGLSALLAVLGVYLWAVLNGRTDEAVRSVTFAVLVIGNLALILVNRSWRLSVRRTLLERRNPTLRWIVALGAVLLVALVTVPALRHTFHLGAIRPLDWVVATLAGCGGVAWFEIYKSLHHRRPTV